MEHIFYHSIRLLVILVFCCGCSLIPAISKSHRMEENVVRVNERDQVEELLNTALPAQTHDLHYFKSKPSNQLDFYTVYIKFSTSRAEFLDLMKRMNMYLRTAGGEANFHLPAAWTADSPPNTIPWWNPSQTNPDDAAAKSFGTNGWIVAKYENECVYMIVTDTGFAQ
jgi:hypothetical protein